MPWVSDSGLDPVRTALLCELIQDFFRQRDDDRLVDDLWVPGDEHRGGGGGDR